MNSIIYSKNRKNESKYRIQFESKVKPRQYKTKKIYYRIFYKDSSLTNQLSTVVELIDFVIETRYWLRELFVCGQLISNDSKADLYQNTASLFFLHYFYDFTNRIYVFDQRLGLFIKNNPDFKTPKLIDSRKKYNYVLIQTKFRINYVHYNRQFEFRKSLVTMKTFLAINRKSTIEIFSLDYMLNMCIKAFKTQEKIARYIDALMVNKLKVAEKYNPKSITVSINKQTLETKKSIRSMRHKIFKLESYVK